ncbi:nitroreductase family deazaflavin-dependent oxidoreductase [Streptomyces sp. WAC05374]|uniref:nitroreductase/quinone reductase family protein n=1 Tax=Streptomyces sp. WAC05374 TaxID=2487420 RepID=UPI000F877E4C|nr:nitroreductase/quinone reductase family protein [Streptomyces sp. WAC05374]RST15173.1 nitroreductase family deazaflavin-dependent oxidoreductase [Streptomyces sp. WAC05374]TDF45291.1 nitroreductase family deazaflavin-dependent oxidoreductase [Streptomyces sp. WAC05374]TDF55721.1 nitroreductase family deazaflavin-dependent oxidoreductase [Streptomyces sp. WAC05374]TDF58859.1 nitroreductase family deazaflavin-dependent oxidoreductase [Streptomyces sp. WAC05374]
MPNDFNQPVIEEFRANHGRVGGWFEGARLLLLTTTGARSGKPHTTPVGYLPDGDRVLVIASAAGAPKHPAWYHNLLANPRVTVESGVFTYEADATVLRGEERDRAFARAVESDPGWAEYQAKTDRVIPVVALTEVPGPPNINAKSMGEAIKVVHDAFRHELALIRKEIAESGTAGGLATQLRVNCLTVCQGLHNHHTGEDTMLFPMLGERYPELAPVMDRLKREHERIAALLAALKEVVSDTEAEPGHVLAEVERLTDELEAHLTYEEEQLLPVLDAATA